MRSDGLVLWTGVQKRGPMVCENLSSQLGSMPRVWNFWVPRAAVTSGGYDGLRRHTFLAARNSTNHLVREYPFVNLSASLSFPIQQALSSF